MPLGTGSNTWSPIQGPLQFSQCRNAVGDLWTDEVQVASAADFLSGGGCWFGDGYGAIYSVGGSVKFKPGPNPNNWTETPIDVGVTGNIWGLARNHAGILCALIDDTPYLSRDRGYTWEAGGAIGGLTSRVRTIVSVGDWFLVVQPDGKDLHHWVSMDGGISWL